MRRSALQSQEGSPRASSLYRARQRIGLSAFAPIRSVFALILIGLTGGGCSLSRGSSAFADMDGDKFITGSIKPSAATAGASPTAADLAFARNAASDVLTRGSKDSSQPWENPSTGARGSVTPIATSYTSEGKTCRDFLASYVNGSSESWLQGAACQTARGQWDIHTLKPWNKT